MTWHVNVSLPAAAAMATKKKKQTKYERKPELLASVASGQFSYEVPYRPGGGNCLVVGHACPDFIDRRQRRRPPMVVSAAAVAVGRRRTQRRLLLLPPLLIQPMLLLRVPPSAAVPPLLLPLLLAAGAGKAGMAPRGDALSPRRHKSRYW